MKDIQRSLFVPSTIESNVLFTIKLATPEADFNLVDGAEEIRMVPTRHFEDRGVPCVEYRPSSWVDNQELRVRFYVTTECGTCKSCSCRTVVGEDAK